ncbi:acyl-homoserine-lactone synthase TraI [Rhizobium mesoamericanum]|uniref:Acyl-homoserine-lactone synthase n=1 Tax=Rhizobium mesoamericanum STM3625 TaxID=1211777 RepID=K0Q6D2_9HYPH|nr:acyl-homoserine-lactone synthase TraI [Rhizobium mesoamericanum]CCM79654.1 putative acyl-homoserine-lactone synthase [Rhizobium mesoamericanum STM3625]
MQVFALNKPRNVHEARLLQQHHQLRARVFSARLGWEVDVVDGLESDRFDTLCPTYVLAVSNAGDVSGCARLLPSVGPTMVTNVFPSLLPKEGLNAHAAMVESSRFCVDTTLEEGRGAGSVHEATLTMFAGIIEWCLVNAITEIVTVTDLRFERILGRVGWSLQRIGDPKRVGVTTAVAGVLQANAEAFERLRPSSYRSQFNDPLSQAA